MQTIETRENSLVRSDEGLQAEILESLWRRQEICTMDMESFTVTVQQGIVTLSGHLNKGSNFQLIDKIVKSFLGVLQVNIQLVIDHDLTVQVAQALARDKRTRSFVLPVGCSHGWVHLGGEVPSRELQIVAEEIAAQVPSVRGVLSRPKVVGENPEAERRVIQPRIKAKVYDYNRQEGVVTHVVIEPRNRLVTRAVVSISDFHNGKSAVHEHLIPVEAMDVVNQESIILKRNGAPLNAYPVIELSSCPLAPSDWQPPYPYEAGTVRWPCEEQEQAGNRSSSSRLFRDNDKR
jgi:osmotically-inducible protein OsmY